MAFRRMALLTAAVLCFGGPAAQADIGTPDDIDAAVGGLHDSGIRLALSDPDELTPHFDARPDANRAPAFPAPDVIEPDEPDEEEMPAGTMTDEPGPLPKTVVSDDISLLPEPVRRMRELIIEAARSGDPERMRPLIAPGVNGTQLSVVEYDGDPIDFLRNNSGDGKGQEILAILLDILAAGYAHVDEGEPTEMYVWPYFYAIPLGSLDDRQMVELFRIITAGDFEDMKDFGSYIFYRVGISPDGDWRYFVAGD